MAKILEINFGALAPEVGAQLKNCGLKAEANDIEHWEKDRKALARLRVRGVLSDSESRKAEARLFKSIKQGIYNTTHDTEAHRG